MKKLIAFILAVALVMSLVACCSAASAEDVENQGVRFQLVADCAVHGTAFSQTHIFVDTHTGVLYLGSQNSGYSFMTVLVNADGTPMIWEGYE